MTAALWLWRTVCAGQFPRLYMQLFVLLCLDFASRFSNFCCACSNCKVASASHRQHPQAETCTSLMYYWLVHERFLWCCCEHNAASILHDEAVLVHLDQLDCMWRFVLRHQAGLCCSCTNPASYMLLFLVKLPQSSAPEEI